MFTDNVRLKLTAGKGGNGVVAWRREKYIPKGGPFGGNGGKGGSIVLKVDPHLLSLENYRSKKCIRAEGGAQGKSALCHGRDGKNLVLTVPLGTVVKDCQSMETLYDFTEKNQEFIICHGGKGGKGNAHFKSPTNQAPTEFTEGAFGEEKEIELELKTIADIGLAGLPNAGKSTLLKAVSNSKAKIAPYPFTTLYPNLGVLYFEDSQKALIADIPGIIKNAHKNRGLGLSFLKHIERTLILILVIDISGQEGRSPIEDFNTLIYELSSYNGKMLQKPRLIALNKMDLEGAEENLKEFKKSFPEERLLPISSLNLTGIKEFIATLKAKFQDTASSLFSKRE